MHLLQWYLAANKDHTGDNKPPITTKYIDTGYKDKEVQLVESHLKQKNKVNQNNMALKEATKRQLLVLVDQLNDCEEYEALVC